MSDQNIHVRFFDEGGPGVSRASLTSKVYTYKTSQEINVGDIVIVRVYSPKDGPLRFAKVESIGGSAYNTSDQIKRIIQKLDTSAMEAEARAEELRAEALALLKRKQSERTQIDLFHEVEKNLTPAERVLLIEGLGLELNAPTVTNVTETVDTRKARVFVHSVIDYRLPTDGHVQFVEVQAKSLEEAIRTVRSTGFYGEARLTACWL